MNRFPRGRNSKANYKSHTAYFWPHIIRGSLKFCIWSYKTGAWVWQFYWVAGGTVEEYHFCSDFNSQTDLDPKESVCQYLESFPSHINLGCLFCPMVQTQFVDCIYRPQPVIYGPPPGHNQSNSNLLTSINRATITFYGPNPLIFSPAAVEGLKKQVKKQRGSEDAISRSLPRIISYKWWCCWWWYKKRKEVVLVHRVNSFLLVKAYSYPLRYFCK